MMRGRVHRGRGDSEWRGGRGEERRPEKTGGRGRDGGDQVHRPGEEEEIGENHEVEG